jgi:hypothetical protein
LGQSAGEASPSYDLSASDLPDQITEVACELEVGGDLSLRSDGKVLTLPTSVVADIRYAERVLTGPESDVQRSVRYYENAQATIKVDKGGVQPTLGDDRRLIVVDAQPDRTTMFSPQGLLTRDELDLIDIVGNSLLVGGLLPGRPVAVGEKWDIPHTVLAPLIGLEAVAQSDVRAALGRVEDDQASVLLSGRVDGAVSGVSGELELKGAYRFDLTERRITHLELAIKEKRGISHVGPGLDIVAKLKMTIEPAQSAQQLSDNNLAQWELEPSPESLQLAHQARKKQFAFSYHRDWYITSDEPEMVVLRLVRRGELVAQCNLSALPEQSPEKLTTMEQFQKDIRFALGDRFGQFAEVGEWTDEHGQRVFRVVAVGQVEELPIQWHYYLLANRTGRRVAAAFTVETSLAEQFGDADRQLIDAILLPAGAPPAAETASRPIPAGNSSK